MKLLVNDALPDGINVTYETFLMNTEDLKDFIEWINFFESKEYKKVLTKLTKKSACAHHWFVVEVNFNHIVKLVCDNCGTAVSLGEEVFEAARESYVKSFAENEDLPLDVKQKISKGTLVNPDAALKECRRNNTCPYQAFFDTGTTYCCARWGSATPLIRFNRRCTFKDLLTCPLINVTDEALRKWDKWLTDNNLL